MKLCSPSWRAQCYRCAHQFLEISSFQNREDNPVWSECTFKVSWRDPSARAGLAFSLGTTVSLKLQLFPEQLHHRFRITRTGSDIFRCYFVDPFEIVRIQEHIERVPIFAQIFSSFRPRNWDDIFALRQDPGQGELRGRATFFPSNLAHLANEIQITLEIFSLKPRGTPPVVVLRQVFEAFDLAGQEPATERGIGDKTDAELAANTEHFLFWIARPE